MAYQAPPKKDELDPQFRLLVDALNEVSRNNKPKSIYAEAGFTPEQEAELSELPKPKKHRKVKCKSLRSGATFVACVVESRTHAHGRIVSFEGYTHPAGAAVYQSDGGLVPNGMQMLRAGIATPPPGVVIPKHDLTPPYMQWRWEEFWQKDLREYGNGAALERAFVIDDEAWNTPWQEGRVGALHAA